MSPLPFSIRNPTLVQELVPYVVVTPFNRLGVDLCPFGWPVREEHIINPLAMRSDVFLTLLHKLDGLTFGPEGMPMPKWVFYDCAELPGAIYGLGRPAATLWPRAREFFGVPDDYDGIVPLSMYIAIPMHQEGVWFGHNLASLAPVMRKHDLADIDLRGLGSVTKGLALKCFGASYFWGATQWLSKALYIHVKFGALDLATTYTPAHSTPETLTYGFAVTAEKLRAAMGDPTISLPEADVTEWVDGADDAHMRRLQDQIEGGERYQIVGPPQRADGRVRVPLARVEGNAIWPGLGGLPL